MKIAAYIITALLGSCAPAQCQTMLRTAPPRERAPSEVVMPTPAPEDVVPSGWYNSETGEPVVPTTTDDPCVGICGPAEAGAPAVRGG